jgi:hypothetical protein
MPLGERKPLVKFPEPHHEYDWLGSLRSVLLMVEYSRDVLCVMTLLCLHFLGSHLFAYGREKVANWAGDRWCAQLSNSWMTCRQVPCTSNIETHASAGSHQDGLLCRWQRLRTTCRPDDQAQLEQLCALPAAFCHAPCLPAPPVRQPRSDTRHTQ